LLTEEGSGGGCVVIKELNLLVPTLTLVTKGSPVAEFVGLQ
jgi:hypothetical protein